MSMAEHACKTIPGCTAREISEGNSGIAIGVMVAGECITLSWLARAASATSALLSWVTRTACRLCTSLSKACIAKWDKIEPEQQGKTKCFSQNRGCCFMGHWLRNMLDLLNQQASASIVQKTVCRHLRPFGLAKPSPLPGTPVKHNVQ